MDSITLRMPTAADAKAVAAFCQPIYASVYPNAKYNMKPEHFSKAVFETQDTYDYFAHILENNAHQWAYLAETKGQIVGSISLERLPDFYEIHGFYVGLDWQGQGIGTKLLRKILAHVTDDVPIRVEVAEANLNSIQLYRHWGFKPAPQYETMFRHWPEWPEGVANAYIFLQASKADLLV